jgi:hypothetical protein
MDQRGAMPRARIGRRRLLTAGVGAALALGGLHRAAAWPAFDDPAVSPDTVSPSEQEPEPGTDRRPEFSDVAAVEPWDALLFLAGRNPRYPNASLESLMGFSPADILETMDTVVLDSVNAGRGGAALGTLYRMIASDVLETMLSVYGDTPVMLALDAGHGGKRGVYYDPGSNGTEAEHARRVVNAIEERAADRRYESVIIRRIFNDALGDDFGLPPPEDRKGAAALTIRNVRASMLAAEVEAWNQKHAEQPVATHVISVHFNAGSGGILVLHQGSTVRRDFRDRSIEYASAYVARARPALNRSGLLPYQLALALGTGLSDDRVLYEPVLRTNRYNPYTGADRWSFPRRYAMLQSSLLQRDYALGALMFHRLI